jgi:GrpB-like predicted nucleotidyltransferase (UPF0157 family)
LVTYPKEVTQRFHGTPEQMGLALVGERPAKWEAVVVEDYDPRWVEQFATAGSQIHEALGRLIVSIEHVGSTAVPGLPAKPVIDIDALLQDTAEEAGYVPALEKLGYRLVLREPWWYGHRMLVSSTEDVHLHLWPEGAPEPLRHRLFRDWLRSHPEDRELYASTKRRLARDTTDRPGDYTLAKSDVIDEIFARIFASEDDAVHTGAESGPAQGQG